MDVALKIEKNYATLDGLLKNSKDIEHLDLILEWAGHDAALVSIFLPFVKEVGVERAATALIMGEDIISCPEIRGSALKQLPAYGVAKRFWKKAPDSFKEVLIGFAPFYNYLPRCHESYSRDFTIKKQTFLHPVFNFFTKYNPKAAQKQTTNILSMQLVIVSMVVSFLPILKSMGLIRVESMMGSSNVQSGLPVTVGQQAPEGIMLHSIHPVFSLFLRHQAKKAGFMLWPEQGGKQSRKSMCLEKTFVDYHEDRALEWMEQRSTNSTNVWDSSMEADLCKNSLIAAMEIKLRSPSERYNNKNLTPAFLLWCWSMKDRDQSMLSPMPMEYLAAAAERALVKCRIQLDMFQIAPAGLTIDEYLGTAKKGVQLCILLALHCIFNSAQDNKLAYYTSAADEILKRCDALGSLRNNYHFPERILMEEQLDKIRRVQHETGPCKPNC